MARTAPMAASLCSPCPRESNTTPCIRKLSLFYNGASVTVPAAFRPARGRLGHGRVSIRALGCVGARLLLGMRAGGPGLMMDQLPHGADPHEDVGRDEEATRQRINTHHKPRTSI